MARFVCNNASRALLRVRILRALPANWLKIDGGFVAAAFNSARDRSILKALLTLRDPLDVRFIAEGVETQELKDFVMDLGFDAAQGFAIGRPEAEPRIVSAPKIITQPQ